MSAALILAGWLAAGGLAGVAYFWAVWATARHLAGGGSHAVAFGLTTLRFALLAGLLFLAARGGAGPLFAAALGVVAARLAVVRRLGRPS